MRDNHPKKDRLIFRPFHWFDRNVESTVTVGYLVIAMTLYVTVAGVWNTGVVTNQKIRTQSVADVAAHGAATRIAAGINEMTMLNMLALRARAALVVRDTYFTVALTVALVATVAAVVYWVLFFVSCAVPPWVPNVSHLNNAIKLTMDSVNLWMWFAKVAKADRDGIQNVLAEAKERQNELKNSLASDIQRQLQGLQDYLTVNGIERTKIYVSHPDASFFPTVGGSSDYVFKKADDATRLLMLGSRVVFADTQWLTATSISSPPDSKPSWQFPSLRNPKFFKIFKHKITKIAMLAGIYASLGIRTLLAATNEDWGYNLKSMNNVFSEWSGSDPNDRRIMQVLAVAEYNNSNQTFMARGFFKQLNDGNSVVAVAQGEAGNVYDEVFHSIGGDIPVLSQIISFPWRMWSSMGANYQGRLSRVDPKVVNDALRGNDEMQKAWKDNTNTTDINLNYMDKLFLH